jgi:hypothetical protein
VHHIESVISTVFSVSSSPLLSCPGISISLFYSHPVRTVNPTHSSTHYSRRLQKAVLNTSLSYCRTDRWHSADAPFYPQTVVHTNSVRTLLSANFFACTHVRTLLSVHAHTHGVPVIAGFRSAASTEGRWQMALAAS